MQKAEESMTVDLSGMENLALELGYKKERGENPQD